MTSRTGRDGCPPSLTPTDAQLIESLDAFDTSMTPLADTDCFGNHYPESEMQ